MLVALGSLGVLAVARGRVAAVLLRLGLAIFVAWALFLLFTITGYRDADGFIDCDPCTPFQAVTEVVVIFGWGVLAAPPVAWAVALGIGRSWRWRADQSPSRDADGG